MRIMAVPRRNPAKRHRSSDDIRRLILDYFYERNAKATSARGKRGVAAKISDIKKELKASHDLTQQEVWGNLTYLISQGWVEEEKVEKKVPLNSGTVIPNTTSYFKITAHGIDKIEGPGEFTMDKFRGIKIEATGQNIITVGDGNQVDARYEQVAGALAGLKQALLSSNVLNDSQKIDAVSDIDSIQAQLAKASPNKSVVGAAWEGVKGLATLASLTTDAAHIA
jgi:hypothetical protein